jgi:hypothetical protein
VKIFVGGASSNARELVRRALPTYDLVFGDNEKEPQRWRAQCQNCTAAVIMTKFISHKHVEAIRSAGVTNVVYTNGGTNGLIEEIRRTRSRADRPANRDENAAARS